MALNNISFNNSAIAFASKNNEELNKVFWLFKLMNHPLLVRIGQIFASWAVQNGLPVKKIIKKTIFKHFCGGESITDCENTINSLGSYGINSVLDYSVEGNETESDFDKTLNEKLSIINYSKNHPSIQFCVVKMSSIARHALLEKLSYNEHLTNDEVNQHKIIKERLNGICQNAYDNNMCVFVDAEETFLQKAIDDMVLDMMEKYNIHRPVVYNTLQMYRWDRLNYLHNIYITAIEKKIYLGIKIVRGAYMEKERKRAEKMNYKSPIQETKAATDKDFDSAIAFCIEHIDKIGFCTATHNEYSTMKQIKLMEDKNLSHKHPHICFAQLFGMGDHISYNLASAGYNVAKYVPYGPIESVLPYLIRRAQENTSIAGQMSRELALIVAEKKRRNV